MTAPQNKVRKGDVVALAATRSATYALGSGRGTEVTTFFTLAIVESATRDGEAKSLRRRSGTMAYLSRKDYSLSNVRTISGANQYKARKLFDRLTWETDEFATADALRNAVVEAT